MFVSDVSLIFLIYKCNVKIGPYGPELIWHVAVLIAGVFVRFFSQWCFFPGNVLFFHKNVFFIIMVGIFIVNTEIYHNFLAALKFLPPSAQHINTQLHW